MPGKSVAPPPAPPSIVLLEVSPAGFVWDGMPVPDRATLELRLREAAALPEPPEIHVQPQQGVKYEPVAQALSSAQRLGLTKIGLVGK
jgi:biopolymer transport protein ExbD